MVLPGVYDTSQGPANTSAASGSSTQDLKNAYASGGLVALANAAAHYNSATTVATPPPAIDPGLTHSGTGNPSTSPFSPITYSPTSIYNPSGTPGTSGGDGAGINPTYLIIGIIAIIGVAVYFVVKK